MSFGMQLILVAIIAVMIASIMQYLVYNNTGWKSFTMNKHENFMIDDIDPAMVHKLKFRDCRFTITGVDKTTKSYVITSVLNGMVAAYKGNTKHNYIFKLDDPGLSVYSFQIPGFNDKDNKPDVSNWSDDKLTSITLTGQYKLLK